MLGKEEQIKLLMRFVANKMNNDWYGGLDLRFENGNIVHLCCHRSHKIEKLPREELGRVSFDSIRDLLSEA